MPDVTSTLLAMYQQVIGGSSAREQSSLEAEAARRVILSGLTITGAGVITVPGTVQVANLSVQFTVSVGTTLTVTGTASVGGLLSVGSLSVVGLSTLTGAVTMNSDLTIVGTAAMGAIACSGVATITGTLTQNGALNLNNLLTVGGFGAHSITAPGVGALRLQIRNTQAGAGNASSLWLGNDLSVSQTLLQSFASNFTNQSTFNVADGATLVCTGAGGLTLGATAGLGVLKFFAGNATGERMRLTASGELCLNRAASLFSHMVNIGYDGPSTQGVAIQNINATPGNPFQTYYNSLGTAQGSVSCVGTTGVLFNTTSDARLKIDDGLATDLTALRAVAIHEFHWRTDDRADRGVFAQEAYAVFPRAVTVGTDEETETGDLARPWGTDYSKFVPDLIVGWQQHEDALRLLRADLQQLIQMTTYAKYQS